MFKLFHVVQSDLGLGLHVGKTLEFFYCISLPKGHLRYPQLQRIANSHNSWHIQAQMLKNNSKFLVGVLSSLTGCVTCVRKTGNWTLAAIYFSRFFRYRIWQKALMSIRQPCQNKSRSFHNKVYNRPVFNLAGSLLRHLKFHSFTSSDINGNS